MFLLARFLYEAKNFGEQKRDFEETKFYNQVKSLAASIEIAHNASLLQDDIIDKADSRRS